MYIWIDDIYSSTRFKQRLWQTKMNGFDITKFFSSKLFEALRGAVRGQGIACKSRWTGLDSRRRWILYFVPFCFFFFFSYSVFF